MILIEKTIEKFGYHPDKLKRKSDKLICVVCDYCNKEIVKEKRTWLKGRRHIEKDACSNCRGKKTSETANLDINIKKFNDGIKNRFWEKVDKKSNNECWQWTGSIDTNSGYGLFSQRTYVMGAHRVSWELHFGKIPEGQCVLHRCDCRPCVNPNHLFLGTKQDNVLDMINKNRNVKGEQSKQAKLTEKQVIEIRKIRKDDPLLSYLSIARMYGVGECCIQAVVQRRTWKHVQ